MEEENKKPNDQGETDNPESKNGGDGNGADGGTKKTKKPRTKKDKVDDDNKPDGEDTKKTENEENTENIDIGKYIEELLEGNKGLKKIGYSYLLAQLHKRAGKPESRTEIVKVNPDILKAVCSVIREEFGTKNLEEQIEMALLLVLYVAR